MLAVTIACLIVVMAIVGADADHDEGGDRTATTWTAPPDPPATTALPTAPAAPSFGRHDGEPAPFEDRTGFCNAAIDFVFAVSSTSAEIQELDPYEAQRGYRALVSAWFAGTKDYPAGPVAGIVASFGTRPLSDEAITLRDLGRAIADEAEQPAGSGPSVQDRSEEWSNPFVDALDAAQFAYNQYC